MTSLNPTGGPQAGPYFPGYPLSTCNIIVLAVYAHMFYVRYLSFITLHLQVSVLTSAEGINPTDLSDLIPFPQFVS